MGILRTLAHAFRNFQTGMIQVLFVYSKERPKGKGEEKVKFVCFFKVYFQFCFEQDNTSQQVLCNVESCPSTCLQKLLQDKECVLLLPKQTITAAFITWGLHPSQGDGRAGTQPNFVFFGEQTAFKLIFLSLSEHMQLALWGRPQYQETQVDLLLMLQ